MASGLELATAYVSIVPSTSALGKGLSNTFKGVESDAEATGKRSGNKFAQAFGRWTKRAVVAGAVAAGAVAGAALVSGFRSAVDQQQGQAVLSGLYGDASKAQQTLQDLKKVSKKSPLEYSGYQKAAESLAYAGVEGDSAIGVLENVGKAITAAGGGTVQLEQATGGVMKAVNNGGIAMMDSLGMISESGVPILSGLAEHFGVGIDEVKRMASAGEVNITDVMSVMENATGDTFQKMLTAGEAASKTFGSQWKIAKDNVQVALGETLLPLIEKLTPAIAPIGDAIVNGIERLPAVFERVSAAIRNNMGLITNLGVVLGMVLAGMVAYRVTTLAMAAATTVWNVVTKVARIATAGWAVQQRILNTAMRANPIGLVITAIMLLVGAFILAYKNSETFRNIVQAAWAGIKAAALAVWNWIKSTLWPGIQAAWNGIAAGALWLYNNAILPAWNGIRTAIGAVASWVMNTLVPLFQSAWTVIGNAARWLWNNVMKPVWNGIKLAIAIAVTAILVYIDLLKWYFTNVIAPVARWLWQNVMKPVWNGIKSAIGAVVSWFRNTAWPILSTVINWIRTKFEQFKIGLGIIWAFIKNRVINPVISWFQNTVWPIISKVIGWIRAKFEQFKNGLKVIWDFIKNRIINPVVAWYRDVVWPIFARIIGKIWDRFAWFRDKLKAIWNYIKDNIIAPVVNWFMDTVKPKIDNFTGKVKSAFDTLKDGVLKAWGKIKSGMKKPINGVIDIYNEHIAGNFNKVADTLKLDDKYRLAKMKGFATGGYTGPGSKYKEAGIVHADEYVIRKESQNDLARRAPGFLASLNRHGSKALGYAGGGLVKLRSPFGGSYPRGDGFGARGGKHKGIDWAMPSGTMLKAVAAGVARRTSNSAAGNKLELSIGDGLTAGYHHLSRFIAKSGQSVAAGANVGAVGSTGRSSGPHLHFSLKKNGSYVDPAPYLGAGGSAGSGGGDSWWNPFTGLWKSIKDKVSSAVGGGPLGGITSGVAKQTISGVGSWVTDKIAAVGDTLSGAVDVAGGSARWSGVATEALMREGQFGPKRLAALLRRMNQESGFNPRAINNWDSNAAAGNASRGLMQVIPPTFQAYRDRSLPNDIYDPLANIVASIRYTMARYGDLEAGWNRKGGYANGGLVKPFLHDNGGWHNPGELSVNQTRKPEAVLTNTQWQSVHDIATGRSQGGGQTIVQVMPPSTEDPGTWGRRVAESLDLHSLASAGGY